MTIFRPQSQGQLVKRIALSLMASLCSFNVWANLWQCTASPDYISETNRFAGALRVEQDYSCLTSYPDISSKIKTFQIVDIRKNPTFQIEHSWRIPTSDLKHKTFLAKRPLLLLGEGFSRVDLASDCALLKKAGFTNVKMLIGGAPLWRQVSVKVKPTATKQFASARELITEHSSGRVIIISLSKNVSEKLRNLGITQFYTTSGNDFSEITDIVVDHSNGGFDAVVYIGDSQSTLIYKDQRALPNLYELQGGIDELVAQLNRDVAFESSRKAPKENSFCAK